MIGCDLSPREFGMRLGATLNSFQVAEIDEPAARRQLATLGLTPQSIDRQVAARRERRSNRWGF